MFVILPVGGTIKAMPVLVLMGLLFVAGSYLGWTAVWLFTAWILLDVTHFWAVPVALLTGMVVVGLARQAFRNASEDSEEGFFALGERSASVVLVLALLALGGGSWLGVFAAKDERQFLITKDSCVRIR
jgi:hypothetical protein